MTRPHTRFTSATTQFVERDLAAVFALACVVLGGASAAGFIANAALQIVALVVIATILLRNALPALHGPATTGLRLLALAAALMLAQLVPLPAALWSRLPGREEIAANLAAAGGGRPWLPVSLTPDATVAGLLSLIVPLATMLAIFAATPKGRRRAIATVVVAALGSLAIGVAQRAGGGDAGLYPYLVTNRGSAVGLFANRNHLATLLLCALPLTMLLHRWSTTDASLADRPGRFGRHVLAGAVVAALALGVVITGSVAGWATLVPVLAASTMLTGPLRGWRLPRGTVSIGLVLGVAALVALGAQGRHVPLLHGQSDAQHRPAITATTLRAAAAYLPFGAGGGSFTTLYPRQEDPRTVTPEYINHAHNDYAETLLEFGLPGAALLAAAFFWWGKQIAGSRPPSATAATGAILIAIVATHSGVDYPLRTAAIAMILALGIALISVPVTIEE